MEIRISRRLLDEILAQAQTAGAQECCGLLFGSEGHVRAIGPAANVAPDPQRHFEIDPMVLLAAQKAERAGGTRVIGYYHSHPNGVSGPSLQDAEMAASDGRIWIVVANGTASAWRAGATGGLYGRFDPVTISIG